MNRISLRISYPVSQFTSYPVEELKSEWATVSNNFYLVTDNLYLKLTFRINWSTGKTGNWVTKLTGQLILIGQLNNLAPCILQLLTEN